MIKIIYNEAALLVCRENLVISDLHLGIEKELASKGFRIPSYTLKMIERIRDIKEKTNASNLIILGDVKHSVGKVEDIDWQTIPSFFEVMLDLFSSVSVLPGNHDGNIDRVLPNKVKLHPATGIVLTGYGKNYGLAHGHAWPSKEGIESKNLIIGHSHFSFQIRDKFGSRSKELVWLVTEYDVHGLAMSAGYKTDKKGKGKLIVMPPFNKILGGQPINSSSSTEFGPVLSSRYVDIENSDVFLLDGTRVSFSYN